MTDCVEAFHHPRSRPIRAGAAALIVGMCVPLLLSVGNRAGFGAPTSAPVETPLTKLLPPPAPTPASAIEREPIRRAGERASSSAATRPRDNDAATRATTSQASGGSTVDYQRLVLSAAIVLAVIFLARWAARKLFPAASIARSSQAIRVLSRSVLAPKQQFLLIQVGRRLIVVGDSGTHMSPLSEITDPDEVAALVGQLSSSASHVEPSRTGASFLALFGVATARADANRDDATADSVDRPATAAPNRARELLFESDSADEPEDVARQPPPDATDPHAQAAATEIAGLLERVRSLASHVRRP